MYICKSFPKGINLELNFYAIFNFFDIVKKVFWKALIQFVFPLAKYYISYSLILPQHLIVTGFLIFDNLVGET